MLASTLSLTPTPSRRRSDFDGAWKFILEVFLPQFFHFFFPHVAAQVDWNHPFEFLEQELRRVTRRARTGRRAVDKLVRVRLLSGTDLWILIHLEIQSQPDPTFPARMFVYYYRLRDRYGVPVASFAVLTDPDPEWRPEGHTEGLWGTRCEFHYEGVKLLDYAGELERLRGDRNPFAAIVEVHLRALATRRVRPERRLREKLELVRSLYRRGFTRDELEELLQFLDRLLVLPENLEAQLDTMVTAIRKGVDCRAGKQGMDRPGDRSREASGRNWAPWDVRTGCRAPPVSALRRSPGGEAHPGL